MEEHNLRRVTMLITEKTAADLDRLMQTPEQIIVPPCSVGSIVYWVIRDLDGMWKIFQDRVVEIGSKGFFVSDDACGGMDSFVGYDTIGKDVFLSFEKAKAVMEERMQYG